MNRHRSSWSQRRTCAVSFLVSLIGACGADARLDARYVTVHNVLQSIDWVETGTITQGSLGEGGETTVDVPVRAGECRLFVALASGGVRDVDLVISDGTRELVRDDTVDLQSTVTYCPSVASTVRVAVRFEQGSGDYVLSSWSSNAGATRRSASGVASASCADAPLLTLGTAVTGETTGGSRSSAGSCAQGDSPERVFRLVLAERMLVRAVVDANYDSSLYILGSCGGAELGCNDDAGSQTRSALDVTLDAGTYFVVVDGYSGREGRFELRVDATTPMPIADVCSAAEVLVPGQRVTSTTEGAMSNFQASCARGANSGDKLYRLEVAQRSRVRLDLESDHDGALHVRRSCEDASSEVACNDDFGGPRRSQVNFVADPGTYFVIADGFEGSGRFSLEATVAAASGGNAAGDSCSAPEAAALGIGVTADVFAAADDFTGSCGGQGGADIVYRVQVERRSRLTVEFSSGAAYVRRACADAATEVACARMAPDAPAVAGVPPMPGSGSSAPARPNASGGRLETTLDRGTYFLVLDSAGADAFAPITATVNLVDSASFDAVCRAGRELRPGETVHGDSTGHADRFRGSCLGNGSSPDDLYKFRLARRQNVTLQLDSPNHDGGLYIRRTCEDAQSELACNDDAENSHQSRITTTLDQGTYFVLVDGFGANAAGSYDLLLQTSPVN